MLKKLFFFASLREFYGRKNILRQLLAAALTYIAVISGFDWYYYLTTQNSELQAFLFPAIILGGLLPIVLPAALLLAGKITGDMRTLNTAFAVIQSALLGLMVSSFYKIFTGRIQPPHYCSGKITDISRNFEFGFFRHGIFWGWPSSHTTVAFAVAVTLLILYPKNRLIQYSAIFTAFYIGIGVSTNIHWFSDFLAGVIIGSVIGSIVGKSFLGKVVE